MKPQVRWWSARSILRASMANSDGNVPRVVVTTSLVTVVLLVMASESGDGLLCHYQEMDPLTIDSQLLWLGLCLPVH